MLRGPIWPVPLWGAGRGSARATDLARVTRSRPGHPPSAPLGLLSENVGPQVLGEADAQNLKTATQRGLLREEGTSLTAELLTENEKD